MEKLMLYTFKDFIEQIKDQEIALTESISPYKNPTQPSDASGIEVHVHFMDEKGKHTGKLIHHLNKNGVAYHMERINADGKSNGKHIDQSVLTEKIAGVFAKPVDELVGDSEEDVFSNIARNRFDKFYRGNKNFVVNKEYHEEDQKLYPSLVKKDINASDTRFWFPNEIIQQVLVVDKSDPKNKKAWTVDLEKLKKIMGDATETDVEGMVTIKNDKKKFWKRNAKLAHSGGGGEVYYSINLPALQAIVFDKSTNKFSLLTTCPGAGKCMLSCYAAEGMYNQGKGIIRRLQTANLLYNHPDIFEQAVEKEIVQKIKSFKDKQSFFRFNDAGDFFCSGYLQIAINIAKRHPEAIFYAYTKNLKLHESMMQNYPKNFIINLSYMSNRDNKILDIRHTKKAIIFPEQIMIKALDPHSMGAGNKGGNLFVAKLYQAGSIVSKEPAYHVFKTVRPWEEKDMKELEWVITADSDAVAKKIGLTKEETAELKKIHVDLADKKVISYDEMLNTPYDPKNDLKFAVIVKAQAHIAKSEKDEGINSGDAAATRKDVYASILLEH
jgi:hypothetical protein